MNPLPLVLGDLDTLDAPASSVVDPEPPPASSVSGWWTLLAITREAAQIAAAEAAADPVACPNDGEPLRRGPRGELRCPFDGWMLR